MAIVKDIKDSCALRAESVMAFLVEHGHRANAFAFVTRKNRYSLFRIMPWSAKVCSGFDLQSGLRRELTPIARACLR
jgi:hypothetical protein